MTLDLSSLLDPSGPPRLILEVALQPAMGRRFQPTGFPDLGPALYDTRDGQFLVVESAQSMANRLEQVCWDDATERPVPALEGMSYVRVVREDGTYLTSTLTESHRLNSPYILESKDTSFAEALKEETRGFAEGPLDRRRLAATLFRYDLGTLLHGVFLAKKELAGGRLRLERALSSFIEADGVRVAALGGVKKDEVNPQGDAKKGFGHVPFHRDEYTADHITAFFKLDLAQIRAYGLPTEATELLVALGLFKVRRLLDGGLRLRTACDLDVREIRATRPVVFELPGDAALTERLQHLIKACKPLFADPSGVRTVTWREK